MQKDSIIITMNLSSSALVTRSKNGFIIKLLESGKSEFIGDEALVDCKSPEDFMDAFTKPFTSTNILLSADANQHLTTMLPSDEGSEDAKSDPADNVNAIENQIPYYVINLNTTLLVTRCSNEFKIELLQDGKNKTIPSTELYGNSFKYPYDFSRKFAEKICESSSTILMSAEANNYMIALLAFNRIDC